MPRSGSTLLRVLLSNIKGCVSLPETFFFVFYNENKRNLNPSSSEDRKILVKKWINYFTVKIFISDLQLLEQRLNENTKTYRDIFDITIDFYFQENNIKKPSYIVEKSPPHIFFQEDILELFPESKAIYLLRDIRDVAGSMLNKSWSTHNIYPIARSWNKSIQLFGKIKNSIVVKYEDLITKDENVLKNINSLFSQNIVFDDFFNVDKEKVKGIHLYFQTNLLKPVSDENIDKSKIQLSTVDRELQMIEIVAKKSMIQYGYTISKSKKDIKSYLFLYVNKLHFFINKLIK